MQILDSVKRIYKILKRKFCRDQKEYELEAYMPGMVEENVAKA
jgi:hypothetical protein